MANLTIRDTGYANTGNNGTQETMANSGTALTLRGITITYDRSNNNDSNPNPARYEDTEVNYVSQNNAQISISGAFDSTVDSEVDDQIKILDDMITTKGLKILYYGSSTDGFETITSSLGNTFVGSIYVDGVIKFLLVRFTSFRVSQESSRSVLRYTLTAVVTNG